VNLRKVREISSVLVKSQLRSSRSGTIGIRLFSSPIVIWIVDVIIFVAAAGLVYLILWAVGTLPADMASVLDTLTLQAVTSLPALIAPFILVAAVLFELSVSSKFASSDVVNWLPVSQTDYVTASALSVSYMYSFLPALALGAILPLAAREDLLDAWGMAAVLSAISLLAMGALVEMIRAAINRVSSLVYGKAGRGTIVIRLVVTVVVILALELGFNPTILSSLIGSFTGVVNAAFFVPFFWPSVSISYFIQGASVLSVGFFGLSVLFTMIVLLAAVKVRARYWSPVPVTIEVTEAKYEPRVGFLQSLGLSAAGAAIVRKDLKGYTRRRELIPQLALPVVFVALLVVQQFSLSTAGPNGGGIASVYPFWLVGGIMAVIVAASSVGQEGKAILNVYASPVSPQTFFRAKLLVASMFGWATMLVLLVASSILASSSLGTFLVSLAVSLVVALECTLVGFDVATRFPDLQERPRPRFVRPMGLFIAMVVGVLSAFVTALPLVLWPFMGSYLESLGLSFGVTVAGCLAFGVVVSIVAYRLALSGASELLAEIPI
jgi:hypothetical protein